MIIFMMTILIAVMLFVIFTSLPPSCVSWLSVFSSSIPPGDQYHNLDDQASHLVIIIIIVILLMVVSMKVMMTKMMMMVVVSFVMKGGHL